jgi:hypothetical protein
MRVAHADLVHVVERVLDVVDAGPAHADPLRDEPGASVQVELVDVRECVGSATKASARTVRPLRRRTATRRGW